MARITIEDCLEKINNHFELVLVASRRARQLQEGGTPRIEVTDEKPSIIALREIAAGLVGKEILTEPLIKDVTAESELAELLDHGIMDQKIMARAPSGVGEAEDAPDGVESRVESLTDVSSPKTADSMEVLRGHSGHGHRRMKTAVFQGKGPAKMLWRVIYPRIRHPRMGRLIHPLREPTAATGKNRHFRHRIDHSMVGPLPAGAPARESLA